MTKRKPPEQVQKRGRKPKYSETAVLQQKIDEYFINCPDFVVITNFDKNTGEYQSYHKITPTMCGLALYLGFVDRRSLYDNEQKPEFSYIIKKARLRIENEYEKQLHNSNCTGAIFALKNLGWKDKQETEISTSESTQEAFLKHLKELGKNAD